MHYTIFEMKKRQTPDPSALALASSYEAQMRSAEQVGLAAQITDLENKKAGAEMRADYEGVLLAPEEVLIWGKWATRHYVGDKVKEYRAQPIPPAILAHWGSCKGSKLFGSYQILTNHDPYNDKKQPGSESLLIGVAGDEKYLLARWTEEGADLRSFTDIKMIMWKQRVRVATFSEALMLLFVGSMFLCGVTLAITHSPTIALIVSAIAYGYGVIKFRDRSLKDDDTAQALMKYGCQTAYGYSPF